MASQKGRVGAVGIYLWRLNAWAHCGMIADRAREEHLRASALPVEGFGRWWLCVTHLFLLLQVWQVLGAAVRALPHGKWRLRNHGNARWMPKHASFLCQMTCTRKQWNWICGAIWDSLRLGQARWEQDMRHVSFWLGLPWSSLEKWPLKFAKGRCKYKWKVFPTFSGIGGGANPKKFRLKLAVPD